MGTRTHSVQVPQHVVAHGMDAALLFRALAGQHGLPAPAQVSHGLAVLLIRQALSHGVYVVGHQLLGQLLLQLILHCSSQVCSSFTVSGGFSVTFFVVYNEQQ